jgi:1-acyl-sn-glycerol-3-phosphate acyltransferase
MLLPVRKRSETVFCLTKTIARPIFSPFFKIRTEGLDNLPDESAFILLPKHQRWEDIPLLGLATPRPLYYMAKYELFRNPVSGWFLSRLGGIPLNRQRPLASRLSLRTMIELLKKGEGIVIFPEGTYYKNRMGPGRPGLVKMVFSRVAFPFIPVGIRYMRKGRRNLVRIHFGRPIYKDSAENAEGLLQRIMQDIARLSSLRG